MIVVETLLREIFSQIPDIDYAGKQWPVKYHWGGQDDLNLYMQTEAGNQTPLIWLVNDKVSFKSSEADSRIKIIIAKSSENKGERNPIVWDSEFVQVLNPLLEKVIKCFQQSGITTIVNQSYDVYREANYSEYAKGEKGVTKTIDHWNVIIFESNINFNSITSCVQTINFN